MPQKVDVEEQQILQFVAEDGSIIIPDQNGSLHTFIIEAGVADPDNDPDLFQTLQIEQLDQKKRAIPSTTTTKLYFDPHIKDEEVKMTIQHFQDREKTSGKKSQVSVKDLRHSIPALFMHLYLDKSESVYNKTKVKGIWENKPADWPSHIPFCDPNNQKVPDGKGGHSKPNKEMLMEIFSFLVEKYNTSLQEYSTGMTAKANEQAPVPVVTRQITLTPRGPTPSILQYVAQSPKQPVEAAIQEELQGQIQILQSVQIPASNPPGVGQVVQVEESPMETNTIDRLPSPVEVQDDADKARQEVISWNGPQSVMDRIKPKMTSVFARRLMTEKQMKTISSYYDNLEVMLKNFSSSPKSAQADFLRKAHTLESSLDISNALGFMPKEYSEKQEGAQKNKVQDDQEKLSTAVQETSKHGPETALMNQMSTASPLNRLQMGAFPGNQQTAIPGELGTPMAKRNEAFSLAKQVIDSEVKSRQSQTKFVTIHHDGLRQQNGPTDISQSSTVPGAEMITNKMQLMSLPDNKMLPANAETQAEMLRELGIFVKNMSEPVAMPNLQVRGMDDENSQLDTLDKSEGTNPKFDLLAPPNDQELLDLNIMSPEDSDLLQKIMDTVTMDSSQPNADNPSLQTDQDLLGLDASSPMTSTDVFSPADTNSFETQNASHEVNIGETFMQKSLEDMFTETLGVIHQETLSGSVEVQDNSTSVHVPPMQQFSQGILQNPNIATYSHPINTPIPVTVSDFAVCPNGLSESPPVKRKRMYDQISQSPSLA